MKVSKSLLTSIAAVVITGAVATTVTSCSVMYSKAAKMKQSSTGRDNTPQPPVYDCPACGMG